MLSELLQGSDSGGVILIQDCANYSARHLLKSFISAALHRNEDVHILLFEISEEELRDGLKDIPSQSLHIHNAYKDPLGWSDEPIFTVHQFCFNELTRILKQTALPKTTTLVIDSLSWILRHISTTAVCSTLHHLKKGGAVRAIIGLLHADMHQKGTVGSVCQLATSLITVAPSTTGDKCVAKITKRTKSGKVLQDEHIFSIQDDLTVTVQSKSIIEPQQILHEEHDMDPTTNLTFNLRLSDREREAKEKLSLPFMFSKEKKKALLHVGAGSGRILYEPDANDDFDQEDPDDDLDV